MSVAVPIAPSAAAPLEDLQALTSLLRAVFEDYVAALASRCAAGGVLDNARLDRHQLAAYEVAFAAADLLAVETLVGRDTGRCSELQGRLILSFGAEALRSVLDRLQQIALDLDVDAAPLYELRGGTHMRRLETRISSGAALDETGRLLLESADEVGAVVLNDELSMAQAQFRRLAAELLAPMAARIHRENLLVPDAILRQYRETGVFGLSIPERHGGSAPDDDPENSLMMIVVTEALSEASLAAGGSLITRPEILSRALLAGGTAGQQSQWLPKIASGEVLCAIGITEPNHGSDVANLQLRGTRAAGGWRLNGAKTWCTFAGKAGLIMVVARTSADRTLGHRGLSVLLVEKPAFDGDAFDYPQPGGGRLAGKAIATLGYRGMHSFDLTFENYFVPDSQVLGGDAGVGKGFYFTMAGMVGGRMQTAARACGLMRAALRAALRYAADRNVFGAPLGSYSLTRAKLARMAARFDACRWLTYAIGAKPGHGSGGMEASLVKLFTSRAAEWLTREALQIHGGMGYAEESAVSRYFVDARVLSLFEGSEETLAIKVVARTLLERALRRAHAGGGP